VSPFQGCPLGGVPLCIIQKHMQIATYVATDDVSSQCAPSTSSWRTLLVHFICPQRSAKIQVQSLPSSRYSRGIILT